jgi:hypothetical protein
MTHDSQKDTAARLNRICHHGASGKLGLQRFAEDRRRNLK